MKFDYLHPYWQSKYSNTDRPCFFERTVLYEYLGRAAERTDKIVDLRNSEYLRARSCAMPQDDVQLSFLNSFL
jgi:hypothetical protein